MTRSSVPSASLALLLVQLTACATAPSDSAPGPSEAVEMSPASTRPALSAQIVPTIGGLFPIAVPDEAGTPVPTSLVLRVTNDGEAPVVLRTGGDDEGFELTTHGPGVVTIVTKAPCTGLWQFGAKHVIAPHGYLDVPIELLRSGGRCGGSAHYLTTPGLYEMQVSLHAHVHASAAPPAKGERGTPVLLEAPLITLRAAEPR